MKRLLGIRPAQPAVGISVKHRDTPFERALFQSYSQLVHRRCLFMPHANAGRNETLICWRAIITSVGHWRSCGRDLFTGCSFLLRWACANSKARAFGDQRLKSKTSCRESKTRWWVITGANSEGIRPPLATASRLCRLRGQRNRQGHVKARKKRQRAAALNVASEWRDDRARRARVMALVRRSSRPPGMPHASVL